MAAKIFCNACHHYIRDAGPEDDLRGAHICQNCAKKHENALEMVEKTAKRGIVRIERARDDVNAKIEDIMRRVIEPEEADGTDEKNLG